MKYSKVTINFLFKVNSFDYYNLALNYALNKYIFNIMIKELK